MRIVIVANGQFPRKEYPKYLIKSADKIICCDGALQTLEKHGIIPDVVIGDLDSVCQRALRRFNGIKIHDSNQDNNDLTKAFEYTLNNYSDVNEIHILAATGKSEAHTIGNLSLLMEYEKSYSLNDKSIAVSIVSDYCTAFAISNSCELHVGTGRKISIFSPDNSLTIQSEGLVWQTEGVVFNNWWKASLNKASEDIVKLSLSHPSSVLIILE